MEARTTIVFSTLVKAGWEPPEIRSDSSPSGANKVTHCSRTSAQPYTLDQATALLAHRIQRQPASLGVSSPAAAVPKAGEFQSQSRPSCLHHVGSSRNHPVVPGEQFGKISFPTHVFPSSQTSRSLCMGKTNKQTNRILFCTCDKFMWFGGSKAQECPALISRSRE